MTDAAQLRACELLVARLVVEVMADRGIAAPEAEELAEDAELRTRDLSLLGLGSLDWIALATRLEDMIGAEIPDQVLLAPERRCVAGWGEAVLAARTARYGAQYQTH
ncbi:phosphopantetheine-binding protein [Streptomyces sp. NPDC090057]|uniref:phosphopantetheine-binding protein n=1 Tax=Streptomyces sp. NPDC090057 TaxID=3365935 RepID=UPI0037F30816